MTVRDLRTITGLSQREFAKKFNIPFGTLVRWDQGTTKAPSYVVLMMDKIIRAELRES